MSKKMFARIAVALLLVSFIACHKFVDIDDLWHKHNPDCRIEEIAYQPGFGPDTTYATFSYNHKGQPTGINFSFISTGRPNVLFRYNNKGWLTDYIAPYDNGHYEYWAHYTHDANGRIIADSSHTFGTFPNEQPQSDGMIRASTVYEYDGYDRIKKVTKTYSSHTEAFEYLYNVVGNLEIKNRYIEGYFAGSDTFHYDNKVNILRTNRIWMFIDRDYSKNNRQVAERYNKSGLPTRYRISAATGFRIMYSIDLYHADIKYRCK